ncbi:MAG: hypothetical protein SNG04_04485 [Rikenellaceae bacterium]
MIDLFPYPLRIYAKITTGTYYLNPTATVEITQTVCNYQYANTFSLANEYFLTNNLYIYCPYTIIPENNSTDIDLELFPQFQNIIADDGTTIIQLYEILTLTIYAEIQMLSGATTRSTILKTESVKIGKMQGYEVGTTIWVELGA